MRLDFDTALLTSLPSALQKDPASRGTFDNVVVTNVEDELQKRLAKLKETLAEAAPAREERASKVATCAAAVEALKVKLESMEKASKDAVAAMKEADGKSKAAAKALKAFGPEIKATGKALKDAKEQPGGDPWGSTGDPLMLISFIFHVPWLWILSPRGQLGGLHHRRS
ncbi:unnamed protein product [Cladocopium goreaui]|uniref:Uncharacterized protein n=1 Tax=Cladocopium goreaui TaxID=2562237 RepID=A0A9P1BLI2_9DINO|nr:unnamed protein product [Cladocopium goreaui]